MDLPEPILILAKNYNQFKVGEAWLWERGYFKTKRPIRVTHANQLRGLRFLRLFIMDEAESTIFAMELRHTGFKDRNTIFDMVDLRDPVQLEFQLTERNPKMGYTKPDSGKRHLVLDNETLAIHPHAAITEIGVIDLLTDDKFFALINPTEQTDGFVQDPQAMSWHLQRDPNYLINLVHNGMRPDVAAGRLHNWLMEIKRMTGQDLVIWCQGTDFDIPSITNFLKHYQYHLPWKYTDVRDIRTLAALFPNVEYKKGNHNALEDATMAAQHLQKLSHGYPEVRIMLGLA